MPEDSKIEYTQLNEYEKSERVQATLRTIESEHFSLQLTKDAGNPVDEARLAQLKTAHGALRSQYADVLEATRDLPAGPPPRPGQAP